MLVPCQTLPRLPIVGLKHFTGIPLHFYAVSLPLILTPSQLNNPDMRSIVLLAAFLASASAFVLRATSRVALGEFHCGVVGQG